MAEKKVLFFLPADELWARVLRRFVVVAILGGIVTAVRGVLFPYIDEMWIPIITAILTALDKLVRELTEEK